MQRRVPYPALVALLTAGGLAGRLLFLGYQPLWRDEAFTAIVVQRGVGSLLDAVRNDSAPPLAYLLDHLVASVPASPAALRLVPAIAGAAGIPLVAALARRIGGDRAGVAGALLAAVAPALLLAARDARMYALATTLMLASTLLLWRAVETPRPLRWSAYVVVTAAALYTDYFALLAVAAQLVAVPLVLRAGARRALMACAAAAIAVATLTPWLLVAHTQLTHTQSAFWVPPLGFASTTGTFVQFFSGPPVDPWVPLKPVLQTLQGLAVAAGVVLAAVLVLRRERLGAPGRRAALFCTACGLIPVALLALLSLRQPVLDARYASVAWGPLFAVLGAGLALLPYRAATIAAVAVTAATSGALAAAGTHPDTQAAIAAVEPRLGPHDLLDAYPSQYLLLLYYGDHDVVAHTRIVSGDVPWFWGTAAYPQGAVVSAAPSEVTANHGDIFFMAQPGEAATNLPPGYAASAIRCWTGVCVTTFAPPGR